jgi:hypothetical protein
MEMCNYFWHSFNLSRALGFFHINSLIFISRLEQIKYGIFKRMGQAEEFLSSLGNVTF